MADHPASERSVSAEGLTRGEWLAFWICVAWLLVAGAYFWMLPAQETLAGGTDPLRWVFVLTALLTPVGLVWVAAAAARSARIMRAEAFRMQTAVDDLRQVQIAQATMQQQAPAADPPAPAQGPQGQGGATAGFTSRREVSRLITPRAAPQMPADQPALALDTPEAGTEAPPLDRVDLIRALNFPDDENDQEGFAALRRALRDRNARRLVQASQDVLTLLSQNGIYTDDMRPEPIPAEFWRSFAMGARGKNIERLGGVRDAALLSITSTRMREDMIFRDTVHHFLRRFDEMLVTFEKNATDTDLLALAETRTARAFMLLARTIGTFD